MSHYFVVVDSNQDRRSQSIQRAVQELSTLGLQVKTCFHDNFAAAWSCSRAWAGASSTQGDHAALLMGQALESEGHPVNPADLASKWHALPSKVPEPFEGIHMAALFKEDSLFVGADILGRFPVFYHTGTDYITVASSPDLFRCHESWSGQADLDSMACLLMLNYFLCGRTIWKNVRRLGAGNVLLWANGKASEKVQYRMPFSDEHFGKTFEQHCDIIDAELREAIGRHMPTGTDYEMFCSGGLDSRMLAGYLRGRSLIKRAITWGEPEDFEMRCARRVVRKLGVEHETWPNQQQEYPNFARACTKWHSLTVGINTLSFWQGRHTVPAPGGFISGQAMDASIGGGAVIYSEMTTGKPAGFDELFARENGWGIPLPILQKLLRKEVFGDAIPRTLDVMQNHYLEYGERDFQRIGGYTLLHRHRYHTVGVIGLHGFWGWPVLPAFDRRVLKALGGIPRESFFKRRIQKHLVCTRFPDLARLPLDRNSPNTRPLLPRFGNFGDDLILKLQKKIDKLKRLHKTEQRFYYRTMDFNGPGWTAIRHEAEPGRKTLEQFLDKETLSSLVPPPDVPLREESIVKNPSTPHMDTIKATSGAKLLTSLMFWAKERL